MKTKFLAVNLTVITGLSAASAWADFRTDFSDRARVISATPVYTQLGVPYKDCWTEEVVAATAGAATGTVIGDRIDNHDRYYTSARPRQVERCEVTNRYRNVASGYDIIYTYHGQQFTTRLPYNPGPWLNLEVSVSVADRQTAYESDDAYRNSWRY